MNDWPAAKFLAVTLTALFACGCTQRASRPAPEQGPDVPVEVYMAVLDSVWPLRAEDKLIVLDSALVADAKLFGFERAMHSVARDSIARLPDFPQIYHHSAPLPQDLAKRDPRLTFRTTAQVRAMLAEGPWWAAIERDVPRARGIVLFSRFGISPEGTLAVAFVESICAGYTTSGFHVTLERGRPGQWRVRPFRAFWTS